MNAFQKRTAIRISAVSLLLAALASPVGWFVTREKAEQSIVALANEESGHFLRRHDAINLSGPQATERAALAAQSISGGLFDVAEIYAADGHRLAQSLTPQGQAVLPELPPHGTPNYTKPSYESIRRPNTHWMLRVFVPLRDVAGSR